MRKKILRQTDSEIIEIDLQIQDEIQKGILPDPNAPVDEQGNPISQEGEAVSPEQTMTGAEESPLGEVPEEPGIDASMVQPPEIKPKGGKI